MLIFLLSAIAISLSGVMAPGPMTAAALACGTRMRHAGTLLALGHAVVELPLMLLILVGIGRLVERPGVKVGIGLAGGVFLVLSGVGLLLSLRAVAASAAPPSSGRPFWTGVVFTAANPYFLIWWATIGLALATQAAQWGAVAFTLFAIIHWLCDLAWLEVLSFASFHGSAVLGQKTQQTILVVCGLLLVAFGGMFLYDAGGSALSGLLES